MPRYLLLFERSANERPGKIDGETLLDPVAVWNVADILSGVMLPPGAPKRGIAYETGTSYGYRDVWSVGHDGPCVLAVRVGRPDNGAVPGYFRLTFQLLEGS